MATVTTTQLISDVRLQADVVSDPQVSDPEIAGYLSDALRSLYDIFQDVFPAWSMTQMAFTLAGNTQATNYVLLPDDFQSELGLDWLNPPAVTGPVSVARLGTWQDRNRGNAFASPVGMQGLYMRREYAAQGDRLIVYPYYQSAGDYVLDYVPQIPTLAEPIAISPLPYARGLTIDPLTDGTDSGNQFVIAAAAFVAVDNGAKMRVTGSANALDGTWTGVTVVSPDTATTDATPTPSLNFGLAAVVTLTDLSVNASTGVWTFATPGAIAAGDTLITSGSQFNDGSRVVLTVSGNTLTTATAGLVNEFFTAGVSVTYQPALTIGSLPVNITPWRLYLITFAVTSVKIKREEPIDAALAQRLEREGLRARKAAELRSQQTIKQIQIGGPGLGYGMADWSNGTDGDGWW